MYFPFNNEIYLLGFMIIEALFISTSYFLVLREVDDYYKDPTIKNPINAMIKIFWNHIFMMHLALAFVVFVVVFAGVLINDFVN